ncbi:MAG: hypothetical protein JJU20_00085 [Opitutales bacterium]|nr:hypothetical protein [Opitutales bacterium]
MAWATLVVSAAGVKSGFSLEPMGTQVSVEGPFDRASTIDRSPEWKLSIQDRGGSLETAAAVDVVFDEPVDLAKVEAIQFQLYVPEELTGYFFGRNDVRLVVNGDNPRWQKPAIEAGWNTIHWELKNLYTFPSMKSLRIHLGHFMPGFDKGAVHLSEFELKPMEKLEAKNREALEASAANANLAWTRRFQAIEQLQRIGTMDSIQPLLEAIADGAAREGFNPRAIDENDAYINPPSEGSEAVRSAARQALTAISGRVEPDELATLHAILETALRAEDPRKRLAVVHVVAGLKIEQQRGWIQNVFEQALLDDLYYVREQALSGLARLDRSPAEVAAHLAQELRNAPNDAHRQAVLRCLSEMGPSARRALPETLIVLRDTSADTRLRASALRAVWWTDESVLAPEDWVIALDLQAGEIHRHLLNRAMDRLEQAGPTAVPALRRTLQSNNPQARSRAAVLLRKLGPDGADALAKLGPDEPWYVRAAAGHSSAPPRPVVGDDALRVERQGSELRLSNGLIELVFDTEGQDPGPKDVRFPGGENLLDSEWLYKVFSFRYTQARNIIERVWFQKIRGSALNKNLEWEMGDVDDDHAEVIFRYPGGGDYPLEWQLHYVLRRGDSGFYVYFTARNTTGRLLEGSTATNSEDSTGMIRLLVAPTWGMFDTVVLHDQLKGPVRFTDEPNFSGYPDIYQASYRMPDGEVDAKHEWTNYDLESSVFGMTGDEGGVWLILPSMEFFGGAMPNIRNTSVNHNMFVMNLEDKYYNPVAPRITADWEKIYGPMFLYFNQGDNTEAMWEDAKHQAAIEEKRWPYEWINRKDFHMRGEVKGQVQISDGTDPEGAWVILAQPHEEIPAGIEFGEWYRDVGKYHYSTRVAEDGSFHIPDVYADTYSLFVWKEGVYGEFRKDELTVTAGNVLELQNCILEPRSHGRLVWQLGTADRTVREYYNGNNFHQWDTYLRYRDAFPFDVNFDIGRSDPARDWNYLQPASVQGENIPTTWTIAFDLKERPSGEMVLTIVCGGRSAHLDLRMNGQLIGELITGNIGLQHIRTAAYGELLVREFSFDAAILKQGRNQLSLSFDREADIGTDAHNHPGNWPRYIAYDFIRLEAKQ